MNDLQIHLSETANVTNQMNPFFNDYVTSNKKGLHQKNRKEDVSSRPHILFFLSLDFIFLFFQRFNQLFYSSSDLICFFGVTPSPFRLSTLLITLPVPS